MYEAKESCGCDKHTIREIEEKNVCIIILGDIKKKQKVKHIQEKSLKEY